MMPERSARSPLDAGVAARRGDADSVVTFQGGTARDRSFYHETYVSTRLQGRARNLFLVVAGSA